MTFIDKWFIVRAIGGIVIKGNKEDASITLAAALILCRMYYADAAWYSVINSILDFLKIDARYVRDGDRFEFEGNDKEKASRAISMIETETSVANIVDRPNPAEIRENIVDVARYLENMKSRFELAEKK